MHTLHWNDNHFSYKWLSTKIDWTPLTQWLNQIVSDKLKFTMLLYWIKFQHKKTKDFLFSIIRWEDLSMYSWKELILLSKDFMNNFKTIPFENFLKFNLFKKLYSSITPEESTSFTNDVSFSLIQKFYDGLKSYFDWKKIHNTLQEKIFSSLELPAVEQQIKDTRWVVASILHKAS